MKDTKQLLDEVKKAHGLRSDYALAKLLGISRERVSKYRTTPGEMGEDMALKVAALLAVNPAFILASLAYQRAKAPKARAAWSALVALVKPTRTARPGRRPAQWDGVERRAN